MDREFTVKSPFLHESKSLYLTLSAAYEKMLNALSTKMWWITLWKLELEKSLKNNFAFIKLLSRVSHQFIYRASKQEWNIGKVVSNISKGRVSHSLSFIGFACVCAFKLGWKTIITNYIVFKLLDYAFCLAFDKFGVCAWWCDFIVILTARIIKSIKGTCTLNVILWNEINLHDKISRITFNDLCSGKAMKMRIYIS